jgi:hypothetical protein
MEHICQYIVCVPHFQSLAVYPVTVVCVAEMEELACCLSLPYAQSKFVSFDPKPFVFVWYILVENDCVFE